MSSTVSTTAPLSSSGVFTSPSVPAAGSGAVTITGTVFASSAGSLSIQQSSDNVNWDAQNTIAVSANAGQGINVPLVAPYFRAVYTNGSTAQTVFRLYVDLRDDEGNFVAPQTPSAGGEYVVLQNTPSGWQYVGRFDGSSGWDATGGAAIQNGSGKYAAFDVSTGVVANETVIKSTDASATSF